MKAGDPLKGLVSGRWWEMGVGERCNPAGLLGCVLCVLGFGDQPHHPWHALGSQLHGAAMSGCTGCVLYNSGDIISMDPNVNGAPGVVPLRKLCHEPLPMLVPLPTMSFWPDLPLILASFSVPPSCIHSAPTHLFHIYYVELQQSASLSVISTCPPC